MNGSRHLEKDVAAGFSFAGSYGRMETADGVKIYTGD